MLPAFPLILYCFLVS